VVLAGEAGIGKTRLASELQRQARKRGTTVLWGGCSEAKLALPYLPFVEAIGNYLATVDLEELRRRLGPIARELGQLFPQLTTEPTRPERGEDPAENRVRLFEALLALLRVPAEANGLIFVVEDVHWADGSTRELLDYLSRRLRTSRILLLVTCRKEELHGKHPLVPMMQGWRRAGVAQVVELAPLPAAAVAGMVQAILEQPIPERFGDFLHQRSEGNPFVLEEFLKTGLDRVFRTSAGWEQTMMELKIPPSVRETILLRVQRLSDIEAEILHAAAVLGSSFRYATLVAVSGAERATVLAGLKTFVQQQLIEEDPNAEESYRFRHALTREAIYEDLLRPKRAELHGRAAEVLGAQAETAPVELAHHLLAARRWKEAVPVCLQAAEDAERRHGYREAADLYERVLPHLRDGSRRGHVLCRLGRAHFLAGSPARAQRRLEEGILHLEQGNETSEAAGYRITLGGCHAQRSQPRLARAEWERARALLEPEGPSEDLAYACVHVASQQTLQWEAEEALALAQHAVDVAEAAGADGPRLLAYSTIGLFLARLGRVAEGLEYLDRAYSDAMARGYGWIAGNALVNGVVARVEHFRAREAWPLVERLRTLGSELRAARAEGMLYNALGEPLNALRAWEQALVLAQERDAALFVRTSQRGLALAYCALRRFDESRRLLRPTAETERQAALADVRLAIRILLDAGDGAGALREAQVVLASTDWGPLPGKRWLYDMAVEALLQDGRVDDAERLVAQVRTGDADQDRNPYQARIEGRLALSRGDLDRAQAELEAAAHLWREAGYREEESRTQRALAEVKTRQGDRSAAEAALRTVLADADAYGAAFEGQAARQQLAGLGIDVAEVGRPAARAAEIRQVSERLVTVMFVDVRGYTAMAQQQAPQEMANRIAAFYRWVRQQVEHQHGLVDRYEGDAVMATFNVSRPRLDHCLLALQAAIAIRDRAAYEGLPVGAGIAVGPAVVGALTDGADVTALGEATNLAARLQAQAAAGEILLSEEALRRTGEWLRTQGLVAEQETLALKGFAQPIVAYRLRAGARSTL